MTPEEITLIQRKAESALLKQQFDVAEQYFSSMCEHPLSGKRFHKGLAVAIAAQGRLKEGLRHLNAYVEEFQNDIEAWRNIGILQEKSDSLADAEKAFSQCIKQPSVSPDDFLLLLNVLHKQKKVIPQVSVLNTALKEHPRHKQLLTIQNTLREKLPQQKLENVNQTEVIALVDFYTKWFEQCDYQLVTQLTVKLTGCIYEKWDSLAFLKTHLELKLDVSDATFIDFLVLGICSHHADELDAAIRYYQAALRLQPDSVVVHANLGIVLRKARRYADAKEVLEFALEKSPETAAVVENLAIANSYLGNVDKAIEYYHQAIRLLPDSHKAKYSLGIVYLLNGNFDKAWDYYQCRTNEFKYKSIENKVARWTGQAIHKHHILVMNEQGFGDTINFIRYLPQLAEKARKVSVYVQKPLLELVQNLKGLPENCQFVSDNQQVVALDYYIPMLDLAALFDPEFSNVPYQEGYFSIPPLIQSVWQNKLSHIHKPKVGLVWQGSVKHNRDAERSIALEAFEFLLFEERCQVVNLQIQNGEKEIRFYRDRVLDFRPDIANFQDSAALIQQLDLVVSVDTSVAHLSGAMGVPVWSLINFVPDWRWLKQGETTHWYKSMSLYRQPSPGDWQCVLDRLRSDLNDWLDRLD